MGSRAGSDNSRLRRLRRIAYRHGLTILTTKKPDPKFPDAGYMLSIEETFTVILGNRPTPYSATLDQLEAHIDGLSDGTDDAAAEDDAD